MTTTYEGQLEIDHDRGVIYFHSNKTGVTLFRICSLPKPIPDPEKSVQTPQMIDIHFEVGASYDMRMPHQRQKV